MLQWFNKQGNSDSLNEKKLAGREHSPLSDPALSGNDLEFLFNQLLDGIAHGWHLGRIIKFFNNLQPRSNPSHWIAWLEEFEQRIIYVADPSQRRVGAIMMRFGELTQSSNELQELGAVFNRIGKRLLIGDTTELILEYDGLDRVVEENEQPAAELTEHLSSTTSELAFVNQAREDSARETAELTADREVPLAPSEEEIVEGAREDSARENAELTADREVSLATSEEEIKDIEIEKSLEVIEEFFRSEKDLSLDDVVSFTEQPTQSPDLVLDSEGSAASIDSREPEEAIADTDGIESLAALTEQLTVLQDDIPEADLPSDNPDDEITLVAPETEKPDPSTPLSVASFLEAAKALVPQQKNKTVPLTWEEFVVVLEQDETLAQQVARHLQITSTNPHDIVEATVNRLKKHEATKLSPATIELVESWFNLGLKQASAENFQGAIASWDKALQLNPNLSEAWHNRGSALGRLAKYEEAIYSFNRAINLTPGRYQAWNDRAHALYQIKRWEQAVESWDKAISIMSDNYQFWYNRGCALEQLQRFDESISSYEKTLEIKPDFQPARSRYINLVTERSSSSPN